MTADLHRNGLDQAQSHVSYLSALRRWWWMPLLCVVAAGGLAYAFAERGTPEYEAKALLVVSEQDVYREILGLPSKSGGSPQLTISQVIPQVDQVRTARRARRALGLSHTATIDQIQEQTDVRPDQATGTLAVIGTASTPELAAGLANAYAQAYVELRDLDDRRQIRRARIALEEELRTRQEAAGEGGDALSLAERVRQLKLTEELRPSSVSFARPASVPTAPSGPSGRAAALLGMTAGLLLGLALVVLRAHLDRRVRDPDSLASVLGAPVAAAVRPRRGGRSRLPFGELRAADAEPYRVLLAELRHGRETADADRIAVCSGDGTDAASVAWHLAGAAAAGGARTLLIDAAAGPPGEDGSQQTLAAALAGRAELPDLVERAVDAETAQPDVLAGSPQNGSGELVSAASVRRLLEAASQDYDIIFVHTAPIASADAIPFARSSEGVVTVCRSGGLTRDAAVRLRSKLDQLHVRVLGVVSVGGRRAAG